MAARTRTHSSACAWRQMRVAAPGSTYACAWQRVRVAADARGGAWRRVAARRVVVRVRGVRYTVRHTVRCGAVRVVLGVAAGARGAACASCRAHVAGLACWSEWRGGACAFVWRGVRMGARGCGSAYAYAWRPVAARSGAWPRVASCARARARARVRARGGECAYASRRAVRCHACCRVTRGAWRVLRCGAAASVVVRCRPRLRVSVCVRVCLCVRACARVRLRLRACVCVCVRAFACQNQLSVG